jgi:hypothetical protein
MLPSIKGTDWGPGNAATITVTGKAIKDQIQAGTVKYQIYQSFVKSFTSSGNAPYYTCDNKGCDADEPVALKWTNESQQNGAEEDFVLHFQAALPKVVPSTESPNKTPSFRIVVWGEDQRHEPYDFSTTINFKYEEKQPISLSSELLQVRCQSTDHCLELEIPNGFESPFWRDMGYKYNLKEHPECSYTSCSRSTYPVLQSTKQDVSGYKGVVLKKFGTPQSVFEEHRRIQQSHTTFTVKKKQCKCGMGDVCCPLELEQAAAIVYHHQGGASVQCVKALKRTCNLCAANSMCWQACERRNQKYLNKAGCETHR